MLAVSEMGFHTRMLIPFLVSWFLLSSAQSQQVAMETFSYDRFEKMANGSISQVPISQMWREVKKRSQLECASECLSFFTCLTFRYQKVTGVCQLFNSSLTNEEEERMYTTPYNTTPLNTAKNLSNTTPLYTTRNPSNTTSLFTTKNPSNTTPLYTTRSSSNTTPLYTTKNPSNTTPKPEINTVDGNYTYFQRIFCENGGRWNTSLKMCRCVDGYIGRHCEKLMTDCSNGYLSGQYHGEDGIFNIQPTGYQQLQVRCIMKKHGRLVIQSRTSNNVSFNQTWENFKHGFGLKTNDFWLGNDRLHALTKAEERTVLAIEVQFSNKTNTTYYYHNFFMGNESDGYRISFTNVTKTPVSSTVRDCMLDNNNTRFSTWNNRHGNATLNCAKERGGWWYNSCNNCSLSGVLQQRDIHGYYGNHLDSNMSAWSSLPVIGSRMQIYYTDDGEDVTF